MNEHPTGGRRRKTGGPPAQPPLPDLPPLPHGDESSDELDEEKDARRLRSTSTTPRSKPLRTRDPFDYDRIMGMNSARPSSEVSLLKAPFRDLILSWVSGALFVGESSRGLEAYLRESRKSTNHLMKTTLVYRKVRQVKCFKKHVSTRRVRQRMSLRSQEWTQSTEDRRRLTLAK